MRMFPTKSAISALALAFGATGFAAGAHAQADDTDYCVDYEYLYEDADYYDDMVISREEYTAIGNQWFEEWDADDSGYVEEEEFTKCYDAIGWDPGDGYADMDLNDDDQVDEEEFFNEDAYDEWDLDDNDELKSDEWL